MLFLSTAIVLYSLVGFLDRKRVVSASAAPLVDDDLPVFGSSLKGAKSYELSLQPLHNSAPSVASRHGDRGYRCVLAIRN